MKVTSILAAAIAIFGLASCSSDLGMSGTRPDESIEVSAALTSSERRLSTVNTGDTTVYGWNLLEGSGDASGATVQVQMLGNVDYVEGNGDFFGFVTFTFADGSTIGTRMVGEARAASDTTNATFTSTLTVIGGTGRYLDVTGTGRFDGERQDALGGQVDSDFALDLQLPGDG